MFFGASTFSQVPFSTYSIAVTSSSTLEIVAELTANGAISFSAAAEIETIAVLTAAGTLTVSDGISLEAIAELIASPTIRGNSAKVFIWTIDGRTTTWNLPQREGTTWAL